MSHTATYSPEDNKLRIYPRGVRLDDELGDDYASFKAAGYKWAAKQECFVCPRWSPAAEDWALDLAGEIGDEDYGASERAADRAERFGDYRDKRRDEAHDHADTFAAGPDAFGHQSRARAERQAARHDRHRHRALSQWSKAEYWQQRTAGVIAHALYRARPDVRRGRILTLESEQRIHAKRIAESCARWDAWKRVAAQEDASKAFEWAYALANSGACYLDFQHPRLPDDRKRSLYSLLTHPVDPITGHEAAALYLAEVSDPRREGSYSARWTAHFELRLSYERAMLENEGGSAAAVEMEVGGFIRAGRRTGSVFTDVPGGWMQIHGITKSPATGRVSSVKVMGLVGCSNPVPGLVSIKVGRLGDDAYRAPTDEERAAFKASQAEQKAELTAKRKANPLPQLVNPTAADAERLQALWNAEASDRARRAKAYDLPEDSQVLRLTQAEYSARSKGSYSHYETAEVSERLRILRRGDHAGRVTAFKIRTGPSGGSSLYRARRVVVITDKPQRAIPWESAAELLEQQPSEDKLRPRIEELAAICAGAWLPADGTPERQLLNDAQYVGWAFVSSMSQFGWTEAGCKALEQSRKALPEPAELVPAGQLF